MSRPKVHTVSGDAAQALALLVRAKAEGFDVASVSVGTCKVDLRVAPAKVSQSDPASPRDAIYQQFGGEAYRRMTGAPAADPAVRGEEYQPALEVEA